MLDHENTTVISGFEETTRPRRRRAAFRPAGPPRGMTETPSGQTVSQEVEESAPRRRRVATQAAGAGPKTRRQTDELPAAEPEQTETSAEAPSKTTAASPVRRRATRKAAAPTPVESPVSATTSVATTSPAGTVRTNTKPLATEAAPRPARRRATRAAAAPNPVVPVEAGQITEPASTGTDEAEAGEDAIGVALREAEELAETKRSVLSDPFMTAEARESQLAALAGAIAAGGEEDEEREGEQDQQPQEDEPQDEDSQDEIDDEERPSRRRRRRGGRRRRRSRDETGEDPSSQEEPSSETTGDDAREEGGEGEPEETGSTRRRRRRRRRVESDRDTGADDTVTGIEGSTRMEAKRQRRKESRAAGRRRAPILSEAEFLARREAVDRRLVIRQAEEYTQLAVVEDDILVEHYVDKASATSLIGNIYLGKVQNVLPSMEAAFIDIGRGRNAVLYAGEVDWSAFGVTGEDRKVENVLKSGQSVLVQVTKDPVGAKGARLTSHISLPGRYIVYSPGGHLSGISRKLPDVERTRLRTVLSGLISDEESVIVRTAAEGASEEELVRDVNRLKAQWAIIERKSKSGGAPQTLYCEPDLTLRIVRDLFTEDFGHLIVQGDGGPEDAYEAISAYVGHVAPHLAERLQRFEPGKDGQDAFAQFRIDEQIAKALDRKVFLPSGGSLVFDRTEAMTVIDVNTGRFTGSGGNLEATITSNNLEAAEEIVRQLRLRDLGGIIVIDFIDMVLPSNRELLLRRLVECLGRDRTRHQVAEVTSLGLVQLTRKRIGTGLQEAFTEECEHCHGSGFLKFEEPVDSQAPADGGERRSRRRRK